MKKGSRIKRINGKKFIVKLQGNKAWCLLNQTYKYGYLLPFSYFRIEIVFEMFWTAYTFTRFVVVVYFKKYVLLRIAPRLSFL